MPRAISKSVSVMESKDVTCVSRSVIEMLFRDGSVIGITELTTTDSMKVLEKCRADIPALTVQDVIDELEAYEGKSVDLSTVLMSDFVHSVVHEKIARDEVVIKMEAAIK